jgi:hypothetical protein
MKNELEKHVQQLIDIHIQHLTDIHKSYNGSEADLMSSISGMENIILSAIEEMITDEQKLIEITIEEYE